MTRSASVTLEDIDTEGWSRDEAVERKRLPAWGKKLICLKGVGGSKAAHQTIEARRMVCQHPP